MSNQNLFRRRLGKFNIPTSLISDKPLDVLKILSTVIILRAEHMFVFDAIDYMGISDNFDIVPVGEEIPWYRATITENGIIWQKILIE